MIDVIIEIWDFILENLSALATLVLAIIAFWQMKLLLYSPKLKCEFHFAEPDCHLVTAYNLIPIVGRDPNVPLYHQKEVSQYIYYFRLRIENKGKVSAKNVEVIIKDLKVEDGSYKNDFGLNNLLWSTIPTHDPKSKYYPFISPDTYQYCNIGHLGSEKYRPTENQEYPFPNYHFFTLDVSWQSTNEGFKLNPGKYTFDVVVGCENSKKSVNKTYELNFTGRWYDSLQEMFSEGITIKER